jgi:hypothetical protein
MRCEGEVSIHWYNVRITFNENAILLLLLLGGRDGHDDAICLYFFMELLIRKECPGIERYEHMITFDALERIGEEVVVAYFKVNPILACRVPPEYECTALPLRGQILEETVGPVCNECLENI